MFQNTKYFKLIDILNFKKNFLKFLNGGKQEEMTPDNSKQSQTGQDEAKRQKGIIKG